uniref:Dipeptidase n=1 Tax=Mastacembelus armatus TaxID=205130 RepID=A0A7N8X7V9_9TELE
MLSNVISTVILALWGSSGAFTSAEDLHFARALQLMSETPLIDGHNDLPWQLRIQFNNELNKVNLTTLETTHTNIPKIKTGRLGAQFWSAYVPCGAQYKDAVRQTLEQIDVIHRMCQKYPETFMFATSSQDIMEAFGMNKTASLIGVEGGHSIDSSLGTLRTMYQLGQLISEMNRLGMLIDLAHVTVTVMNQVLDLSEAPVIFSHSSAYSICPNKRNVPDDVLQRVKKTGGIVMVNFYNDYVTCNKAAKLSDVADHFDHIKKVAGADIVGFGGDYDGVTRLPEGLEDVSKVPNLVAELLRRGWTDEEVKDALGNNLLRVLRQVENVRDSLKAKSPDDVPIPYEEVESSCRTSYGYLNNGAAHSLSMLAPLLTVTLQLLITLSDA